MLVLWPEIVLSVQPYTPQLSDPLLDPWRWTYVAELEDKGVWNITESPDGTMWFGLDNGVAKYDGLKWHYLTNLDSTKNLAIIAICAAKDGSVYAGSTEDIYRFRNGRWKNLHLPFSFDFTNFSAGNLADNHRVIEPTFKSYSIIETFDGSIWIGTLQGALQIKEGSMLLYSGKQVIPLNNQNMIRNIKRKYPIFNIFEDRNHLIWFGLVNGNVIRTDIKNGHLGNPENWQIMTENDGLKSGRYPKIFQAKNDELWVISENFNVEYSISKYDGKMWKSFSKREFDGVFLNSSIIQTDDGTIWVSDFSELHRYKNRMWQVYKSPEFPVPAKQIVLFNRSANNNDIWMAGIRNDVVRLDYSTKRWTTFRGLNFHCETPNGIQWFISKDGKVVSFNPAKKQWLSYDAGDGLIDTPVRLIATQKGLLCAAGSHQHRAAIAFFDGKKWNRTIFTKLSWGIDYRSVFEARDGSLWFGAMEMKLPEHLGGAIQYYPSANNTNRPEWTYFAPPKVRKAVQQISQTPDGVMWFGSYSLYRFDGEKLTPVTDFSKYTENNTHFLYCTKEGHLWTSCRGYGVLQYDGSKWYHYDKRNGLSGNRVYSIVQSPDGAILVNTENGICRFDGKTWCAQVIPSGIKAGKADGCVLRFSQDGALWINNSSRDWLRRSQPGHFAKDKLYPEYYTVRFQPDSLAPETEITSYTKKVSSEGNITFFWKGIDAWDRTPSNKLVYSYRLGNSLWSQFSQNSYHTFLSLPSGKHILEVKARDNDFNIEQSPARVEFYVAPPVWKTPWFIAGLFIVFGAIVSFVVIVIKQRNLDHLKLQLFTNISHEIRTPLTLIKVPIEEMISQEELHPEVKKHLSLMQRNAQRLLTLINQLLDYNKIEVGKVRLQIASGDIVRFIENIIDGFQVIAKEREINFSFTTAKKSMYAWFDDDKLEKIISNLINNALKYTPKNGSINVSLEFLTIAAKTGNGRFNFFIKYFSLFTGHRKYFPSTGKDNKYTYIRIAVSDTGYGIQKEQLSKIFNPFYQGKLFNSMVGKGAGIGLAYTKELVQIHHGEIDAAGNPGKGTVFTVKIPIDYACYRMQKRKGMVERMRTEMLSDENELLQFDKTLSEIENESVLTPDGIQSSKPLLLIVDDEIEMQSFLADILHSDYKILTATNGKEALEIAVNKIPDIIVSDVMMPEIDGIEFTESIRTNPLTCHIPVIILTAKIDYQHKIKGLQVGAFEYLTKPFHIKELKLKLKNLLELRELWKEKYSKVMYLKPENLPINSLDSQFIERTKLVIEENLSDDIFDYKILAKKLGFSERQLYRKVKALTGFTCNELIRNMRLERAKELILKNQDSNIAQIAYCVGFKEYSYFEKCFKDYFGNPPKKFRAKKHS
ncbi:MAG: response regulator [Actinobacteria bacterium]|nr:response regulator [Actinomycetota bacterium]